MSKPRFYGMAGSMRKGGKRDPVNRQQRRTWPDKAGKSRPRLYKNRKAAKEN